jgi:Tol biopolymer transport system component
VNPFGHRRGVVRGGATLAVLGLAGCGAGDGGRVVRIDARSVAFTPADVKTAEPARAVVVDAPGRRLVALDLATGRRRLLLRATGKTELSAPALSPDGRRVAVVSTVRRQDSRTISTISILDVTGAGRARRVPGLRLVDADERAPVWTPDARALALPHDPEDSTMDLVDVRTGRHRALLRGAAEGPVAFAPDGKAYAFWAPGGLWLHPAGTGRSRLIAPDASAPAWSPDGRHLAYLSTRDHHGEVSLGDEGSGDAAEVYVADADGRHPRRLTNSTADELGPLHWTTDSSAIALARFAPTGVTAPAIGVTRVCDTLLTHPPQDVVATANEWDLHAPLAAVTDHGCR